MRQFAVFLVMSACGIPILLAPGLADDQELIRAKARHAARIARLDDTLEQARRLHRAGVETAHRKLLAAYAEAIVRAQDGWYSIDLPGEGTQFRLNGMLLRGDVELSQGVYEVEIYTNFWGQPYLKYASVTVRKRDSDTPCPLVNTAADVRAFLAHRIEGRASVEVSGYQPRPVDLNLQTPKGKVRQPAPEPSSIEMR